MKTTQTKTKMNTPPFHSSMLILMVLFAFTSQAFAQGNNLTPKLYVVLQHTNEGKCDKMNMERVDKEIVSQYASNPDVVFISYDIKNDYISADTKADVDWFTVYKAVNENMNEEGITIIDPQTKQVVNQVKLNANTADILKTINSNAVLATIPPGR